MSSLPKLSKREKILSIIEIYTKIYKCKIHLSKYKKVFKDKLIEINNDLINSPVDSVMHVWDVFYNNIGQKVINEFN